MSLNKEILTATEQVLEKVPLSQITSQLSSQSIGTIFLQLNVTDLGICIPFSLDATAKVRPVFSDFSTSGTGGIETHGAIVATVESSSV